MKNINKKKIIIIIAGVVVLIGLVVSLFLIFKKDSKDYQKDLETDIKVLVDNFYQNIYYDQMDIETLKSFKDEGIKMTLSSLKIVNDNKEDFINGFDDTKCDEDKTFVYIYPNNDFKKSDYKIEYHLDCGDFK